MDLDILVNKIKTEIKSRPVSTFRAVSYTHLDVYKRQEEEGEAVSSLEKKYSKQIHSILEEQHLVEAERMQIPAKLKNLQADYALSLIHIY